MAMSKELQDLIDGASVETYDPLVALLYHLLMNHVSPAAMAAGVEKTANVFLLKGPAQLSYGLVAYQAVAVAEALKRIEDAN